ncbi:MAG: IS5/IS1182 family transposase, partial [Cyanobacteria bacterium QS_7_48_42]
MRELPWRRLSYRRTRRTGHGSYTPAYPTRLSETQWETLAAYFAANSPLGQPCNTNLPAVVKAILYVLRAGCPWRMLPWEFPPWQTVYGYFPSWRDQGSWKRIHR